MQAELIRAMQKGTPSARKISLPPLLLILVMGLIVVSGITAIFVFNPLRTLSGEKSKSTSLSSSPTLLSPIDLSGVKISVEPNGATPSAYYVVKRTDIKTGKSDAIYKIPSPQIWAQPGFTKDKINQFVISHNQRLIAYATTEHKRLSAKTLALFNVIHIFHTDTIRDDVVYKETVDLPKMLFGNENCANQLSETEIDTCFNFIKATVTKAPLFFTKDDKKLILIGFTSGDVPNQGVFTLNPDGYQSTMGVVSKKQFSKFPLLSPTGKELLLESTLSDYHDDIVTSREVDLTLYSLETNSVVFHKLIKVNSPVKPYDIFEFWNPSFISDQDILVPSIAQLLTVNTKNNAVVDITSIALKGLTDKLTITSFVYYDPKIGKILYQVNNSISYTPTAPVFSINPDGSDRQSFDINSFKQEDVQN